MRQAPKNEADHIATAELARGLVRALWIVADRHVMKAADEILEDRGALGIASENDVIRLGRYRERAEILNGVERDRPIGFARRLTHARKQITLTYSCVSFVIVVRFTPAPERL